MKMHSKETPQKKTNKIRWKSNKNSVKLDLQKKKIGEASTRAAVDGRWIWMDLNLNRSTKKTR